MTEPDLTQLRGEHDELARQLASRRSIDLVRRAAYAGFSGFIAGALSVKLAFDRWFSTRVARVRGPPVYFLLALLVALVLIGLACKYFIAARRLMRAEDARFARMRELRRQLELDP